MIITITLTGLVVTGVLVAVRTSIRASSIAYNGGQLETVLANAADRLNRAPQLCDYEQYVDAAALAQGWSASSTSVTVQTLVSNTGNPAADWGPQTCPADVRPFDVQRLVITATTPDGNITRTMTVVKSDVG